MIGRPDTGGEARLARRGDEGRRHIAHGTFAACHTKCPRRRHAGIRAQAGQNGAIHQPNRASQALFLRRRRCRATMKGDDDAAREHALRFQHAKHARQEIRIGFVVAVALHFHAQQLIAWCHKAC